MKAILTILALISCVSVSAQGWEIIETSTATNNGYIYKIFAQSETVVWMGTSTGCYRYENGQYTRYSTADGLPNDTITQVFVDSQGNVWMGTKYGLTRKSGSSFQNFTTTDGLPSNKIQSIAQTPDGTLYFGTNLGLAVYNGFTFTVYNTNNGMPSISITNLFADSQNRVWMRSGVKTCLLLDTVVTNISDVYGIGAMTSACETADGNILLTMSILNLSSLTWKYDGTNMINISDPLINNAKSVCNNLSNEVYFFNNKIVRYENDELAVYLGFPLVQSSYNLVISGTALWSNSYNCLMRSLTTLMNNSVSEGMNINNLSGPIFSNGSIFEDGNSTAYYGLEVPKGSGKRAIFTNGVWLSGFDESGVLHTSYVKFHSEESPYWTGPVIPGAGIETDNFYGNIWTVTRDEINQHLATYFIPGYPVPEDILRWPVAYAPYIDVNQNGAYEPLEGDYPDIKGDKFIFTIFNDMKMDISGLNTVGCEIHFSVYAYDTSDQHLNNTMFLNYKVVNKSAHTYNNLKIAFFTDFDLGDPSDDYVGCDTLLSLGYAYNGDGLDGDGNGITYGTNLPAVGVVFLNRAATNFMYVNNSGGVQGDPVTPEEFNFNMNSRWKDGTQLTYGGTGYGGSTPTNFMFSGDPAGSGWTEISELNAPGDRRVIMSANLPNLASETSECLTAAIVFAMDSGGTNISAIPKLKQRTVAITQFYQSQNSGCIANDISPLEIQSETVCIEPMVSTMLNPVVSGGIPPYTWSWTANANITGTNTAHPQVWAANQISFHVTVTDATGTTATGVISVVPTAPHINLPTDTIICYNENFSINVGLTSGYSYSWSNGQTGSVLSIPANTYLDGTYEFVLTVASSGCTVEKAIVVYVYPCNGISEENTEALIIYPNPAQAGESIYFRTDDNINSVDITDISGKRIASFVSDNVIYGSFPCSGLYFVRLSGENCVYLRKLQVVK